MIPALKTVIYSSDHMFLYLALNSKLIVKQKMVFFLVGLGGRLIYLSCPAKVQI